MALLHRAARIATSYQVLTMSGFIESGDSRLLSVRETARLLGISRRTLEREISRKRFPPPVKIGSKSLHHLSEVEAYIAQLRAARDGKPCSS